MNSEKKKTLNKRNLKLIRDILLVIIAAIGAYCFLSELWSVDLGTNTGSYNLNEDILPEPKQKNLAKSTINIEKDGIIYEITKLATYDITARVLNTNFYNSGTLDKLAHRDLALAWGRTALNKYAKHITFSDFLRPDRVMIFKYDSFLVDEIGTSELNTTTSNNHIITSTDELKSQLLKIEIGNVVRIKGYLVHVEGNDGSVWGPSSLTRDDTGDGACEIIYAKEIIINP